MQKKKEYHWFNDTETELSEEENVLKHVRYLHSKNIFERFIRHGDDDCLQDVVHLDRKKY